MLAKNVNDNACLLNERGACGVFPEQARSYEPIAAANITLLGIGGAFWGLLIGLVAYVVLNGRLPRRGLDARENAAN